MDKVLEFVSPNRTKWKVLTDHKRVACIGTPMHGENKTVKRKTRFGKKSKSNKHTPEDPKMLEMHRLLLNCDNHAHGGEMQRSHEHRWETCKENPGCNHDGSKTEPKARLRKR